MPKPRSQVTSNDRMNLLKKLKFICLWALWVASALSVAAGSQYDDEFEGTTLSKRWLPSGGPIEISAGQAIVAGQLMLAFGPARLTQPWSVETQLECPTGAGFRCGLSVRLTSPLGLETLVGVARQSADESGLVLLAGTTGAEKFSLWKVAPELANAKKIGLRLESMGQDLTSVRCGV